MQYLMIMVKWNWIPILLWQLSKSQCRSLLDVPNYILNCHIQNEYIIKFSNYLTYLLFVIHIHQISTKIHFAKSHIFEYYQSLYSCFFHCNYICLMLLLHDCDNYYYSHLLNKKTFKPYIITSICCASSLYISNPLSV